jgi:hypothetical protein
MFRFIEIHPCAPPKVHYLTKGLAENKKVLSLGVTIGGHRQIFHF